MPFPVFLLALVASVSDLRFETGIHIQFLRYDKLDEGDEAEEGAPEAGPERPIRTKCVSLGQP